MLVSEALEEMDGVAKADASHDTGTIVVEYDEKKVDLPAIRAVIEGQGFVVTT